jgi:hypothetical protein
MGAKHLGTTLQFTQSRRGLAHWRGATPFLPHTLPRLQMSISLASIPFFANLHAADMMSLMAVTKRVEIPENTTIFWKGDTPDAL